MKHEPDEVEIAAHRGRHQPTQAELGPLFEDLYAPPRRPAPGPAEQRVLPIDGTLQARYEAWRRSDEGAWVFATIRERALDEARDGAQRIGVKGLVEDVRRDLKVHANNSYTALIARELRDTEPELEDLIELRERTAA